MIEDGLNVVGTFRENKLASIYSAKLINKYGKDNYIIAGNYVYNNIKSRADRYRSKLDIVKIGKQKSYITVFNNIKYYGFTVSLKGNKILGKNPIMAYIIYEDINNPMKYYNNSYKSNINNKTENRKVYEKMNDKNKIEYDNLPKEINKDLLIIITRELENLRR